MRRVFENATVAPGEKITLIDDSEKIAWYVFRFNQLEPEKNEKAQGQIFPAQVWLYQPTEQDIMRNTYARVRNAQGSKLRLPPHTVAMTDADLGEAMIEAA